MRLRHIPGAEQMIEETPHVVHGAKEKKGTWQQIFGNDHPIRIEVGMGKGQFILEQASRNPDVNFVGIEKYSTVLLKAIRKREQMELSNIYFLCEDARELAEIFGPGEVERIYLNFSDPWPKDRHARRRLTSPPFMAVYDQILQKDGRVEFKTDNQDLFSYSLEAIPEAGWRITEYTRDLHHSEMAEGNVMTEYEAKFSAQGKPICKLVAVREGKECCKGISLYILVIMKKLDSGMDIKKQITRKLIQATSDKVELNKQALKWKKSMEEAAKALGGGKKKPS